MAENGNTQKKNTSHELSLLSRKHMRISGVLEVIGFDGYYVELSTSCGRLCIDGENIKIGTLDTDSGVVELDGDVSAFTYSDGDAKEKKSFFKRSRG